MRVYVLALDGVFDLGLSAILDAFQTANELIAMMGLDVPQFEVKIVGMRKTVRTAHGLKIPVQPTGRRTPAYVIVPAIACKTLDTLKVALARPDVRDAGKAFRTWAKKGATLTAACAAEAAPSVAIRAMPSAEKDVFMQIPELDQHTQPIGCKGDFVKVLLGFAGKVQVILISYCPALIDGMMTSWLAAVEARRSPGSSGGAAQSTTRRLFTDEI